MQFALVVKCNSSLEQRRGHVNVPILFYTDTLFGLVNTFFFLFVLTLVVIKICFVSYKYTCPVFTLNIHGTNYFYG